MMIRSITPADQEQLGLLEEELHDNEGKEHRATLEEALGSKEAISLLAEQAGDAVAYLLATEDQPLKGDLIVLRLAVRPAFKRRPNCIATSSETSLSRSRLWLYFDRCFKGSSCSKGKESHLDRLPRRLTILFFPARISR